MFPIVVVSQRVEFVMSRDEVRDMIDQNLIKWLLQVGVLPVPVPNVLEPEGSLSLWLSRLSPQAIILSGGNDIGSCPQRDSTETSLIEYSLNNDLPMLGICRGMQMMANYAGSALLPVQGHSGTRHELCVDTSEVDPPMQVNSYHDWMIDFCPDGYEIIATAKDGTIEMIRHLNRPWEGWMWHPEREESFLEEDIARAHRLLLK